MEVISSAVFLRVLDLEAYIISLQCNASHDLTPHGAVFAGQLLSKVLIALGRADDQASSV